MTSFFFVYLFYFIFFNLKQGGYDLKILDDHVFASY